VYRHAQFGTDPVDDAHDVAPDVFHAVGRQALVDELAHVEVLAEPAETQERRVVVADVLSVRAVQGLEPLAEVVIGLEPDENRLVGPQLEQSLVQQAGLFQGLHRASILRSRGRCEPADP